MSNLFTQVLESLPDGVAVRVKVVPNASRSRIAGVLGDRLKITVAAPAEGGKANKAICQLLADLFQLPVRDVRVAAGASNPQKTVHLLGVNLCQATQQLQQHLRE